MLSLGEDEIYLKQFSFSYNYYYSIFFSRLFLSSSSSYILFLNSGYEYWILLYSTSIYTIFLETRICMLVTKRVREGEREEEQSGSIFAGGGVSIEEFSRRGKGSLRRGEGRGARWYNGSTSKQRQTGPRKTSGER